MMPRLPSARVEEADLVEWHDLAGRPVIGQLTWVVNVTPPGGVPKQDQIYPNLTMPVPLSSPSRVRPPYYEVVTINAITGDVTGIMSRPTVIGLGK